MAVLVTNWRHWMTHYKQRILACDSFTVETLWVQTLYVLFYIRALTTAQGRISVVW